MTFLEYGALMLGCYAALPPEERERLHAWESVHLGGPEQYGTSDWPGWEKYLGKFEPPQRPLRDTFGYVYVIRSQSGYCKIGSSRSVPERIRQLQCGNPEPLTLLYQVLSANALQDERALHARYEDRRLRNEWFALTDEDIRQICTGTCHDTASGMSA